MQAPPRPAARYVASRRGSTAVEYSLLLMLVSMVFALGLNLTLGLTTQSFEQVDGALEDEDAQIVISDASATSPGAAVMRAVLLGIEASSAGDEPGNGGAST